MTVRTAETAAAGLAAIMQHRPEVIFQAGYADGINQGSD
jgi:hypothetical protein